MVDWEKYGIKPQEREERRNITSVDWGKYIVPQEEIDQLYRTSIEQMFERTKGRSSQPSEPPPPEPSRELPFLARVQSNIYNRFIEPVERTTGRFAANVADAMVLGQFRGRELPDYMPEFVRQSTAPAETTAERITDIAGQIAGSVAPVAGAYRTGGVAASRLLSRYAPQAPRVAQEAVRGAGAGLTYGLAREGVDAAVGVEDRPLSERARNVAIETALGGVGDPAVSSAVRGIGRLARNIIDKYRPRETLSLPEPRRRGRANAAETPEVIYDADTRPVGLPATSPITRQRIQNIQEARADLQQTEFALRELENQYERAVVEQYQLLKQQMDSRKGVQPGGIIRDQHGDVVSRYGRVSENPPWYQEFYEQYNRAPTNRELYELAKRHVDEGFRDVTGEVPSWREIHNYDEIRDALNSVRIELQQGIRELDPRVTQVDTPIVEERLRSLRRPEPRETPEPVAEAPKEPETPRSTEPVSPETPERPSLWEDFREVLQELAPRRELGFAALRRYRQQGNVPTETKSQLISKLDREPVTLEGVTTQFYIDWVDDLYRINQFDKYAERILGIDRLPPSQRPYDLALSTRASDVLSYQIITKNMIDIEGNVVGKSLRDIVSRVPRGGLVDFEDYLLNRHAITRYERGEKVFRDDINWTPEKGREIISKMEEHYPMFRQLADEYYEFNNNMVKNWLVDAGLLTREQAARWVIENPTYVPMKRYFPETPSIATRARRGFADQRAPVRRYSETGSTRKIYNPIESTIENVDAFVKAAKRNQVMQALVRNIQRNPEEFKDWAEIVPIREEATVTSLNNANKILKEEGVDGLVARLNDDFEIAFRRSSGQGLDRANVVSGMIDGQPVHVKINDKQLLEALKALTPDAQHWLLDAVGQLTRFFKVLTTGVNPVFGVTRNLYRDIQQAFLARQFSSIPQFGRDLVESFVSAMGNGKLYQQYKNIGGGHASPIAADRNLLAQSKRAILPQNRFTGLAPRGFAAIENFMNALEAVPRLGEFKRAGMRTYDERLRGMLAAQDITTNFKRRGRYAKLVDQVFPYFNAAVQGVDRLARMYRDRPVQALARTFMSITVPTIALYALNYRNPEFQNLNPYIRDNYYMIPLPDGRYVRVAKHRELGIPFSAAVERALDQWLLEDPESFHQFADSVRVAFFPPGLSGAFEDPGLVSSPMGLLQDTIGGPFIDIAKNETFTGAPIVPYHLQGLSPELQYDETTSRVSRYLGSLFGSSPKQLDHLIRSYTGILGELLIPATAPGGGVGEMLTRQVVVDPVFSSKVQTRFYEIKEELDRAYRDAEVKGQPVDSDVESMREVYNQVNRVMSGLRQASRQIEDSGLPNDEKRKYIREIRSRINDLAEVTNKVYRERRP